MGKLRLSDLWWARELIRIETIVRVGLENLSDEAIDELHSATSQIHSRVLEEYRRRMGVIV